MGAKLKSKIFTRSVRPNLIGPKRIYIALGVISFILISGTVGFMILGYTFVEAVFMTVITVSTVGYREVHELSPNGMAFTSILIAVSFGTFAYTISVITSYIATGEYRKFITKRKLEKDLSKISDHVIVCGFGRVGQRACEELLEYNQSFVVIENRTERLEFLSKRGIIALDGDATDDDNLVYAGIKRAKAIITTLPGDADNLYVTLTSREINPSLTIISRASQNNSVKKLKIAGANNVIMPDTVGGAHMANLVVNPDVMEFIDLIRIQGEQGVNLEEVTFTDLPGDFQYKTLGDLEIRNKIGVNIIGFKKSDGDYIINPGADTRILPNSKLFVLGSKEQINLLNRVFGIYGAK